MTFALAALTFGLVAGLKPGPLGIIVIHQTLSKGKLQGFIASLAPIITDGPIILLALLLTVQLEDIQWFISAVSILGAAYLAVLAYRLFKLPDLINPADDRGVTSGLATAVKVNFLNPSPYIFWLTIGSGYIVMGSTVDSVTFVVVALVALCFTKFFVAVVIARLGRNFSERAYALVLKALFLPMAIFSVHLLYTGISVWL